VTPTTRTWRIASRGTSPSRRWVGQGDHGESMMMMIVAIVTMTMTVMMTLVTIPS
jgi:hypothetical protein